jgi:hypothetical protein
MKRNLQLRLALPAGIIPSRIDGCAPEGADVISHKEGGV